MTLLVQKSLILTRRPGSFLCCNKADGARPMRKHKYTFSMYEGWNLHKAIPCHFLKETQTGQDGYPVYRPRSSQDGGFTVNISFRRSEASADNTWIVPYCPLLTKIFNAHINVEYCNSVTSIKHVCKYVNKGSDMAVFELASGENDQNEIHQYQIRR
ncbi:hypothetical protein AVEN_132609-1 [Araneus ventricosus]|uniref:Uncharacterized protein n=1 Tax=Araneus ventricosus TaxID=182803 RepID=A0A4Y2AWM5_ARAVE|nr:hypothetical protein AVEN_132609-1 [Araneus ventricosus]